MDGQHFKIERIIFFDGRFGLISVAPIVKGVHQNKNLNYKWFFPWVGHLPYKIAHQIKCWAPLVLGHKKSYVCTYLFWVSPTFRLDTPNLHILSIGDVPSMSTNSIVTFYNHNPILVHSPDQQNWVRIANVPINATPLGHKLRVFKGPFNRRSDFSLSIRN